VSVYDRDLVNVVHSLPAVKRSKTRVQRVDLTGGMMFAIQRDNDPSTRAFYPTREAAEIEVSRSNRSIREAMYQAGLSEPEPSALYRLLPQEEAQDLHPGFEITEALKSELAKG